MSRVAIAIAAAVIVSAGAAAAQTAPPPTQLPVPKPFPGAVQNPPVNKPADQPERPPAAPVAAQSGRGAQAPVSSVHPDAELLDTFDAGKGQRYVVYGIDLPYETVVDYYKQLLRTSGSEIFRAPAMHRFDLGRFDENTMAYPPSIVVKDYTWNGSPGYLQVNGSSERRYRTIIQIVPTK